LLVPPHAKLPIKSQNTDIDSSCGHAQPWNGDYIWHCTQRHANNDNRNTCLKAGNKNRFYAALQALHYRL